MPEHHWVKKVNLFSFEGNTTEEYWILKSLTCSKYGFNLYNILGQKTIVVLPSSDRPQNAHKSGRGFLFVFLLEQKFKTHRSWHKISALLEEFIVKFIFKG
jgi:hypothetical protein